MWYWVKSPGGAEKDYNLVELKTALREGTVKLEWLARKFDEKRWMTVKHLLATEQVEYEDGIGGGAPPPAEEKTQDQPSPTTSFDCIECKTSLRLRLQPTHAIYRCPTCKTEYRSIKTDGESPVFLVVPTEPPPKKTSDGSAHQKRTVPPEVCAALAVLSLDKAASFEQVRSAYREQVKQYHPDKVAHLGSELKKLAELKTKEINNAYQILEKFYAA